MGPKKVYKLWQIGQIQNLEILLMQHSFHQLTLYQVTQLIKKKVRSLFN